MASENKKRKAKNSFIDKGSEKCKNWKYKKTAYYTKADRSNMAPIVKNRFDEIDEFANIDKEI